MAVSPLQDTTPCIYNERQSTVSTQNKQSQLEVQRFEEPGDLKSNLQPPTYHFEITEVHHTFTFNGRQNSRLCNN